MIKVTEAGQVIYRAEKRGGVRFPNPSDVRLREGLAHNFQVFDLQVFGAEITQLIQDKGQHLTHYLGW